MIPRVFTPRVHEKSIPRESGDDPNQDELFQLLLGYSPRERG